MNQTILVDLAAWYNARTAADPSNPPTRRDVAAHLGTSVSTAQRYLEIAEATGWLTFPLRRRQVARS